MTSKFKVEDNIPIAKKAVARNRSPLREALAGLEIGQCVTVHPDEGQTLKQLRGRLSGLTQGAKEDNPGAAFIHRTVDTEEGVAVRIWRVAPEDAPAPVARKKAASKKKSAAKVDTSSKQEDPTLPSTPAEDEPEPGDAEIEAEEKHEANKTLPPLDGDDEDDPFDGELDQEEQYCSNCGQDLNLEGQCDNEDCPECEDYKGLDDED